jgi:diguanylate cyclase (GGDEF)-like protein
MIDLNGFKRVNDYFGHPIGDRVLQQIANCMRRSVRDSDFLARYGGDEFALLLPKTDTQTAKILARRLQAIVASNPIDVPGNEGTTVTISYGIAAFPKDGNSAGEVLASADRSLYNSKDNHIK